MVTTTVMEWGGKGKDLNGPLILFPPLLEFRMILFSKEMRLALEIILRRQKKILERVCVAPLDCVLHASYRSSLSHHKNVPCVGRLRQCPLPRAAFRTWLEGQWNKTTGLALEPPCPDAPKLFRPAVFGWKELPGGSWSCFRLVSPALCLPWVGTQSQTSACTS